MRFRCVNILVALFFIFSFSSIAYSGEMDDGVAAYKKGDFAAANKKFCQLAEPGDADAQFNLGFMYYRGEGAPRDFKEAAKWFQKAAEQGFTAGQNRIGLMYEKGKGVPQDYRVMPTPINPDEVVWDDDEAELAELNKTDVEVDADKKEAVKWFLESADQGSANVRYVLGLMYYEGYQNVPQDYKEAANWYRKAAEQGKAEAQYNLGLMYYKGEGVAQDYKEAVRWWRKAAEQGHAGAQNNLGNSYHEGEGVPQDYKEAVKWYRKAAEQGNADAQFSLGSMYFEGKGVPQDDVLAYMWFNISAYNGNSSETKARDAMMKVMTPSQIEEAQTLTREWLEKKGK